MKKYIKSVLVLLILALLLSSCESTVTPPQTSEVLQISSTTLNLNVKQQQRLTVKSSLTASPSINWTSVNPSVATVDQTGLVIAVALGTTTIVAESENGTAKYCVVNVIPREYTFEELVNLEINNLPQTVRYYNKQTGELISEYVISSFSLKTLKYGSNYAVYVIIEGIKTYDKDGENATNPILVQTSLYREGGENCNINNTVKDTGTKVGETFELTLPPFEVIISYENKRELEIKIDSVVEQ